MIVWYFYVIHKVLKGLYLFFSANPSIWPPEELNVRCKSLRLYPALPSLEPYDFHIWIKTGPFIIFVFKQSNHRKGNAFYV